jgi:hypothetical protein
MSTAKGTLLLLTRLHDVLRGNSNNVCSPLAATADPVFVHPALDMSPNLSGGFRPKDMCHSLSPKVVDGWQFKLKPLTIAPAN